MVLQVKQKQKHPKEFHSRATHSGFLNEGKNSRIAVQKGGKVL